MNVRGIFSIYIDLYFREVYLFSKLRKVLQRVHFMMEDAIRQLISQSLLNYVQFIESASLYSVTVEGTNKVFVFSNDPIEAALQKEMTGFLLIYFIFKT